ncbi:hypothetical protein HPP92_022883 [Vanilla planifolia]|uniref:BZIP domain-containing protein n=1 Tax=Vanilla planifolia TaxID=51239 RepID=A0A835PT38_VANPL|nr:hypothetical protein HPP92_022883 [Vanilla planifolia]
MAIKEAMESDDDVMRVPEFGGDAAGSLDAGSEGRDGGGGSFGRASASTSVRDGQHKRGRGSVAADREHKRLKRLLRNRVSAQQARERKKVYLVELEERVKELEAKNMELEEKLSTIQNENQMLRKILKNTTANRRGSNSLSGEGLNAE